MKLIINSNYRVDYLFFENLIKFKILFIYETK